MEPDSNGNLICNVCEQPWAEHTVGGNCVQPPVVDAQVLESDQDVS